MFDLSGLKKLGQSEATCFPLNRWNSVGLPLKEELNDHRQDDWGVQPFPARSSAGS